jgi:hypothetical protein
MKVPAGRNFIGLGGRHFLSAQIAPDHIFARRQERVVATIKWEAIMSMAGEKLTVGALFAERDASRRRDAEAAEQLQQKRNEELTQFRQRLENFQLTDDIIKSGMDRIRRAFERGETELMISAFPTLFCSDGGRAVINAGAPPINKPTKEELAARSDEPEWLATMPAGVRKVFEFWKTDLKDGGFKFGARVINFPDGKPGDVGLFISWPKDSLEV